jgi:hypothetical protein
MADLPPEQFCAAPVTMFEDGAETVCVRRTDGGVVRISASQVTALMFSADIKPFSEHVGVLCERDIGLFVQRMANKFHMSASTGRRFAGTLKRWREEGTLKSYGKLSAKRARELIDLRAKGLLISDRELFAQLESGHAEPDPDVTIRYLAIPTANRPERLALCLRTFVENFEKNGRHDAAILVMEDSEDASNKEVVRKAGANSRVKVEHYGSRHRETLIDALVRRTAVPRAVVEFALALPKVLRTAMPARNAFTLMTLGNYIFQTDDDTRCAYASAESRSDITWVSSTNEPCEGWFYPDDESILRGRPLDPNFDVLAAHENLLGKSVASAIRRSARVAWKQVNPELLRSVFSGPGHVGMTSTGCVGDSGLYASGSYLIASTDETIARMCQSAESYDTAVRSGKIMRVPLAQTISRGEYFQGMSYAVDNTQLQPPYFPMGRNADGASALLYLLSDSQSWIAHLPWAIHHQSDLGRKSYLVEHTEQFSRVRLSDIVIYALKSAAPPIPTARSQALVCMGEQVTALGALPADSFKSYVRSEFVRVQTGTLRFLEEKLASNAGKYPQWEKDVRTMSANIKRSISEDNSIIPLDLESEVGPAAALEFAQKSLESYGRLLCGWEEMVTASRNMIQQAA